MLNGFYTDPDSIRLSGRAVAQIVAEGTAAHPEQARVAGTATLTGVGAEGKALPLPVRDLQGDVVLSGGTMSLRGFRTRFGASDLSAEGVIDNYMAMTPPAPGAPPRDLGRARADVAVRAGLLDVNELIAQNEARAKAAGGRKAPSAADLILPPLDGVVRLSADRIAVREIEIRQASGLLRLDHGRIRAENLVCDVFDGTARLDGSLDLTAGATPLADFTADIRQAAVEQLYKAVPNLNRYGNLAGHLQGRVSARAHLQGALTDQRGPAVGVSAADRGRQLPERPAAARPGDLPVAAELPHPRRPPRGRSPGDRRRRRRADRFRLPGA
jgi:autotransporter translocation and assembly factor TamB